MHPLRHALDDAAAGRFPEVDGVAEVVSPDAAGTHAIVEFTGHAFVLTDRDPDALIRAGADGFGGASHPDVKRLTAGPDGWTGSHDAVLLATGTGQSGDVDANLVEREDLLDHPRVARAHEHRRNVRVYADDHGIVTLGHGLVDRLEISVELLDGQTHGTGSGRRLIAEALELVPGGAPVWAQVAPGNAASLRSFLSCGFVPIGAETLIVPDQHRTR